MNAKKTSSSDIRAGARHAAGLRRAVGGVALAGLLAAPALAGPQGATAWTFWG